MMERISSSMSTDTGKPPVQAVNSPRNTFIVPKVTMNELNPVRTTSSPFTRPKHADMTMAPRKARIGTNQSVVR